MSLSFTSPRLNIATTTLEQTPEEVALYKRVLKETRHFIERELKNKQEFRKVSQLVLAQAIRILQQTCSIPEKLPEFTGVDTTKRQHILARCRESESSHIAIGTIWKEAAAKLADYLIAEGCEREVFLFTGEESLAKRRDILKAF